MLLLKADGTMMTFRACCLSTCALKAVHVPLAPPELPLALPPELRDPLVEPEPPELLLAQEAQQLSCMYW